jgi:hypothetical protein
MALSSLPPVPLFPFDFPVSIFSHLGLHRLDSIG